ncbi:hypothetical protein PT974_08659 [Cladobotryum mycophilum]|uniref:Uncharacterized protein n=1 Tax=Cladobotryum mycophilum TaxID=491253 RepID=A0ABR0SEW2_9HYPO
MINDEWENGIKTQFLNNGKTFHIPIPFGGTLTDRFHPPEIKLSSDDILKVFRPVTSQVTGLVEDQIREVRKKYSKLPKFVILVGGFGRSRHLYNCVEQAVKNKVEILQSSGARPWTAVCRGAAIRGLIEGEYSESMGFAIDSRVARASYGTIFNDIPWDVRRHDILDKEWSSVHRKFWAKDQTQWFLRIGENIVEDKPICHAFSQEISNPDEEIVTELIYSSAINPPTRYDETVKPLCRVRWSKVLEFDKLPSWTNDKGETYRTIDFDIRMIANGVSLDFEIFHDGQVVAAKNVAVEFDISSSSTRPQTEPEDGDGDYRDGQGDFCYYVDDDRDDSE